MASTAAPGRHKVAASPRLFHTCHRPTMLSQLLHKVPDLNLLYMGLPDGDDRFVSGVANSANHLCKLSSSINQDLPRSLARCDPVSWF